MKLKSTRKALTFTFLAIALFMIASPASAQSGGGISDKAWGFICAGFSMAIASAICGLAQAKATAAACEGMARNPGAADAIRFALILGLALIESLALYTLVIVFLTSAK
jgi:F-type H+-transporting ATPase subunit c